MFPIALTPSQHSEVLSEPCWAAESMTGVPFLQRFTARSLWLREVPAI